MTNSRRCVGWTGSAALAAVITLSGSAAFADVAKCQAQIEKIGEKLNAGIQKALKDCLDKIRTNGVTAKAADSCERALFKVYNLGGSSSGAGKLGKALAALQSLNEGLPVGRNTCETSDLDQLGHLHATGGTTANAPGTTAMDFVSTWLVKATEMLVIKQQLFQVGDARQLLDSVINLPSNPADCASGVGECGTFCGAGVPPAGTVARPNLCIFGAKQPACHNIACALSPTSGLVINPVGAPVSLSGRKVSFEICTLPSNENLPVGNDFMILIGGQGRTFAPPPVIATAPSQTVCIESVRSEGWCDCTGHGIPLDPSFCIDHIGNTGPGLNDDCGAPQADATVESNCGCAATLPGPILVSPPLPDCKTTAGCALCVNKSSGAPCHSGTANGMPMVSYSGGSGAGDCVGTAFIQLKILPPAICVNAMGTTVGNGTCLAPGSPSAACVAAGGVFCADAKGADGVACTDDDLVDPAAPRQAGPFTTGTSFSTIKDSAQPVQGACGGSTTTAGMNCMTANDCGGPAPTCNAALTPISFSSGPGSGISCPNLAAGNLTNWKLIGSAPALDGAGGCDVGDTIVTFTMQCS